MIILQLLLLLEIQMCLPQIIYITIRICQRDCLFEIVSIYNYNLYILHNMESY